MKILFLTQWYLPEPLTYQSDLAETLRDQGHEVTVLTGFPNWPAGRLAAGYRIRLWQRETINGISVIRVPLYPDHSTSVLQRVLNFASLAFFTTVLGPWLVPACDVIHVNFPPVTLGFPAWVLSWLRRAPITFEVQDLWPETLRATGMLNNKAALAVVGWLANWGYRRAAAIRVISPGFRENLLRKNVPEAKIHVISNWVDTDRYQPRDPSVELAREFGLYGRFNVMFAGTLGLAQGLEAVLQAAALLGDLPDVQFVFVGDGADLPRLRQIAGERNLANVRFVGRVPPDMVARLYPLADVLLVHLRKDPLFRITIPHKVFTYMASGRPVLAAMEGDTAEVVRTAQAGLTCTPGDARAIADAVRQFHALSPAERQAMGENGRRATTETYRRELLVTRVAGMFEAVVKRSKPGKEAASQ